MWNYRGNWEIFLDIVIMDLFIFGWSFITLLLLTPRDHCACSKGGCLLVLFAVYIQSMFLNCYQETVWRIFVAFCAVSIFLILFLFLFSLYHYVSYYIGFLIFYFTFRMNLIFFDELFILLSLLLLSFML